MISALLQQQVLAFVQGVCVGNRLWKQKSGRWRVRWGRRESQCKLVLDPARTFEESLMK